MKRFIIVSSFVLCIVYSCIFVFICSFSTKQIYTYQVGVYKEEENKEDKMKWLNDSGYEGYSYKKDDQYYVLSCISDSYDEIQEHSYNVEGVIKSYEVHSSMSKEEFIKGLKE